MKIPWVDEFRNENVQLQESTDTITRYSKKTAFTCFDHVQKKENHRLSKQALEWIPLTKQNRGKQKNTQLAGIQKSTSANNLIQGNYNNQQECKLGIRQYSKMFKTHTHTQFFEMSK